MTTASPSTPFRCLLTDIAAVLEGQRDAVLARDTTLVERLSDRLAALIPPLAAGIEAGATGSPAEAECALLARQIHHQVLLNQTLFRNGLAVADHFMLALEQASLRSDGTGNRLQVTA